MYILGDISIKGDKSISHRAIMLASMCRGDSKIRNIPLSEDILSTINCLRKTGVKINISDNSVRVSGGTFSNKRVRVNCNNSGTTMRLLSGMYSGLEIPATLIGDSSLSNRPMKRIIGPLMNMGVDIESHNGKAPITLKSFSLLPGKHIIYKPSAQVKSCIILAALGVDGESVIMQKTNTRDHLERLLEHISSNVIRCQDDKIYINGGSDKILNSFSITVPGDISSASYLIALSILIGGSNLVIRGVSINKYRTGFIDTLISMGANIKIKNRQMLYNESVGDIFINSDGKLNPCMVERQDVVRMIDEIPILSLICAHVEGQSEITGIEELKYKESDRLRGIFDILSSMGVDVKSDGKDSLIIKGQNKLYNTNKINTFGDHRLSMMKSCAQILSRGSVTYENCVNISFPEFKETVGRICIK